MCSQNIWHFMRLGDLNGSPSMFNFSCDASLQLNKHLIVQAIQLHGETLSQTNKQIVKTFQKYIYNIITLYKYCGGALITSF